MVGVNRFQLDAEEPYEPLRVDPAIEAQQAERAREAPARSATSRRQHALAALKKAAEGEDNVPYPMERRPSGAGDGGRGVQRAAGGLGDVRALDAF
ncbi:methylmalonyl-CoA mutase family protein [Streptomyces thinghirensis]|nr:methylmalonyl-CoA mutase family protein [Streptomyces thinghirensis]